MTSRVNIATLVTTVFLLVYVFLINIDGPFKIIMAMFAISPVLVLWVAYSVLRFGKYKGAGLGEKEWGYQDFEEPASTKGDDLL